MSSSMAVDCFLTSCLRAEDILLVAPRRDCVLWGVVFDCLEDAALRWRFASFLSDFALLVFKLHN